MSKTGGRFKVRQLVVKHMSGPSPTCDERPIAEPGEWGLLKTTAVVWKGWNPGAHKVPPKAYWNNPAIEIQAGDVVVTKAGPRERVGVVVYVDNTPPHLMVSGKMIGLRPNSSIIDGRYFATILSAEKYQRYLHARTTGMAESQLNFTNDLLLNMEVEIAPTKHQLAIGRVAEALDKQLRLTEALIRKYQQIKAGLMHDLFTRGIGKDGKLRPPRDDAPDLYKQTPIGWLPKEWDIYKVADVVRSAEYGISTSLNDDSDGIPVLRMNNIQLGQFDVSDMKYSNDPAAFSLALRLGDVLYNRTNSMDHVGKAAIWHAELPNCSFASYLVRINLWHDQILPPFFSYWLNQPGSQISLRRFATPAVQQVNINPTNLQRVIISFPKCLAEQKEIVERIDAADKRIDDERRCVDKLIKEKAGLMHDLLTGKVTIKAAEAEHV